MQERVRAGAERARAEAERTVQLKGKEHSLELAKERELANARLRDQIERYDLQMQVLAASCFGCFALAGLPRAEWILA